MMGLTHVPVVKSLHSVTTETGDVTKTFAFLNQRSKIKSCYVPNNSRTRFQRHEKDRMLCVVLTEECDVMANSEELTGATEYLTLS